MKTSDSDTVIANIVSDRDHSNSSLGMLGYMRERLLAMLHAPARSVP